MCETRNVKQLAISVIVPVYGGCTTLSELYERLSRELIQRGESYEIVFVDDSSSDGSLKVLREMLTSCQDIVVVELVKNVGQLAATVHGMNVSCGEIIVTMDDDLQQWPEDIGILLDALSDVNLDLVVGKFSQRKHSLTRNIGSEILRRIAVRSLPVAKGTHFSSFHAMRREVFVRYFGQGSINNPTPGWMYFTAAKHVEVPVRHSIRPHGKSTYSLRKLFKSAKPLLRTILDISLNVTIAISILQIGVAFLGGVYLGVQYLNGNVNSPGFTSIVFLLLAILGVLGFGIAMLGRYLREMQKRIIDQPKSVVGAVTRTD